MREIKFRGKRVDNGEFVYGDLIHGQGSKHGRMYILPQTAIYPKGCHSLDGWDVIPEIVGQFTGVKDYSEIEIYEYDIVTNGTSNYIIKYINGAYWLWSIQAQAIALRLNEWFGDVKVIGNFYDNPELLIKK